MFYLANNWKDGLYTLEAAINSGMAGMKTCTVAHNFVRPPHIVQNIEPLKAHIKGEIDSGRMW